MPEGLVGGTLSGEEQKPDGERPETSWRSPFTAQRSSQDPLLGGSGEKRSGYAPRASERLDSENAVIKSNT
jgi:hypothetical protein